MNTQEVENWAQNFVQNFKGKTVVLLEGPLGTGKTYLVQSLLKNMGLTAVTSPTFSLIQQYPGKHLENIYHIDLYRLEDEDNLESIGFWDLFAENNSVVLIEWSERLNIENLPLDWKKIKIEIGFSDQPNLRTYKIT